MRVKLGIIGKNAVREVVQSDSKFHACKTTTRNDKGKQRKLKSGIGLKIGTLEHFDDIIPAADSIEKSLVFVTILLTVSHTPDICLRIHITHHSSITHTLHCVP